MPPRSRQRTRSERDLQANRIYGPYYDTEIFKQSVDYPNGIAERDVGLFNIENFHLEFQGERGPRGFDDIPAKDDSLKFRMVGVVHVDKPVRDSLSEAGKQLLQAEGADMGAVERGDGTISFWISAWFRNFHFREEVKGSDLLIVYNDQRKSYSRRWRVTSMSYEMWKRSATTLQRAELTSLIKTICKNVEVDKNRPAVRDIHWLVVEIIKHMGGHYNSTSNGPGARIHRADVYSLLAQHAQGISDWLKTDHGQKAHFPDRELFADWTERVPALRARAKKEGKIWGVPQTVETWVNKHKALVQPPPKSRSRSTKSASRSAAGNSRRVSSHPVSRSRPPSRPRSLSPASEASNEGPPMQNEDLPPSPPQSEKRRSPTPAPKHRSSKPSSSKRVVSRSSLGKRRRPSSPKSIMSDVESLPEEDDYEEPQPKRTNDAECLLRLPSGILDTPNLSAGFDWRCSLPSIWAPARPCSFKINLAKPLPLQLQDLLYPTLLNDHNSAMKPGYSTRLDIVITEKTETRRQKVLEELVHLHNLWHLNHYNVGLVAGRATNRGTLMKLEEVSTVQKCEWEEHLDVRAREPERVNGDDVTM